MIKWTDLTYKISSFFTVKEALWFPQWSRIAVEKDGLGPVQKANLEILFKKMDKVRELFGKPITVHVAFRSYSYNKLVKGAAQSSHVTGMAVDFHVNGITCDDARAKIVPHLEEWGMRCENLPGSSWVHLDIRPVGPGGRFFKP